jgi:hypothetical protein
MKSFFVITFWAALTILVAEAKAPNSQADGPDLTIEKATQTSSDFWIVKVKNAGNTASAPTTLKMIATPGGSYSCPVAAI